MSRGWDTPMEMFESGQDEWERQMAERELKSSKQRFSLEEIERESAQTPATGRMSLPVHVVRTFVNAANGETMPTIEDWALAARLTAAELSKAGAEIERLQAVAVAAKRLVQTAHDYIDHDETTVEEPALTALESALEVAGYDMADEEFCRRVTAAPESRDG